MLIVSYTLWQVYYKMLNQKPMRIELLIWKYYIGFQEPIIARIKRAFNVSEMGLCLTLYFHFLMACDFGNFFSCTERKMTKKNVLVSEGKSGIEMAITMAVSNSSSIFPAAVQKPPAVPGGYITISRKKLLQNLEISGGARISSWVESMKASSPTHHKATPSNFSDDHTSSWMVIFPLSLSHIYIYIDTSYMYIYLYFKFIYFLDFKLIKNSCLTCIFLDKNNSFQTIHCWK